ncbi:MFS transporter [Streptomyces rhizosphaericola]|uniref:MFS transporter n=1 Tax=Streptomyces rhizosphaericola TaxID=2564098 RepID=A0ABY2PIZ5_9ACTN|nr:MFS transporter [Streptomyces rhizosphaericola]TGZ11060.1 MFS transporter [Streptomyces rhizosphaericola]
MIRGTFRTVAGLNSDLRALFVSTLLFRAGTMAFPFLGAYLLGQERYGVEQVGLVVGAFGLGALVADVGAGVLLGRLRPVTVMLGGCVGYALVLAVVPALSAVPALLVATLLWGMAFEIYTPASYAQVVAGSSAEQRKIAFSCNRLAINLGMGLGPAVGGLLFTVAPQALFYVNAVCVLAAAGVLLRRSASTRSATTAEAAGPGRLLSPTVRDESRFWTLFVLALPVHIAYALPPILLSTYIIEGIGLPAYWVSVVFVVNAAAIVLFEVPLNKAMVHMSHLRSLLIGYVLAAAGFALTGLTSSGPLLAVIALLWTCGEMIVFPALLSYVSQLSAPTVINRNVSLYSAGVNVGFMTAPQIGGVLSAGRSPGTPWLAAGTALAAASVLMVAARFSRATWCPDDEHPGADDGPEGQAADRTPKDGQADRAPQSADSTG